MILRQRVLVATVVAIAGLLIAGRATTAVRVAVLPTLPPPGVHVAVPGVPGVVDSLIHLRLAQAGTSVVALDTCREASRAAVGSVGGVFDRRTGQIDSSRVERARSLTRESLAQSAGADLFIEPALVFALAKGQHGMATWDDMRVQLRKATFNETFTVARLWESGFRALSLRAIIRDPQGSILEDQQAGLRVLLRVENGEYKEIPPSDWLGDSEANWSAVERALRPLLLRLERDLPEAPGAPADSAFGNSRSAAEGQ